MKRKDPRRLIKAFLEYLDSYHYNENKRRFNILEKHFKHYKKLVKDLESARYITKEHKSYRLTVNGLKHLDYLRELGEHRIEEKNIHRTILYATVIIALSTFIQISPIILGKEQNPLFNLFLSVIILIVFILIIVVIYRLLKSC